MKQKIVLMIIATGFLSLAYTQKVKIKKGIAYVDEKEYVNVEDCDAYSCTYKSIAGNEAFVVQYDSFEKKNPNPRNPKSKAPYSSTVKVTYATIKFLTVDIQFETEMIRKKKIVEAMYNNGVLDEVGNVVKANAEKLEIKYGKDISGTRPIQVITN